MKGYRLPTKVDHTPVREKVLVGCRRCRNTWKEEMELFKDTPRINSAMLIYDCCDKCITDDERKKVSPNYVEVLKEASPSREEWKEIYQVSHRILHACTGQGGGISLEDAKTLKKIADRYCKGLVIRVSESNNEINKKKSNNS